MRKSELFQRVGMATKHCCYGTCRNDSRYVHAEHMKDVFLDHSRSRTPRSVMQQVLKNANVGFTHADDKLR